jgi:lysophospholipase L1-like esterase
VAPTRVDGIAGPVAALALGERHSCALAAGEVFCWGANAQGQLGDGTDAARAVAAKVKGLPGPVSAIASGRQHVCALVAGEAICWGGGAATPARVSGLATGLARLAAGGDRSCAAAPDGVWCWTGRGAPSRIDGVAGPVRSLAVGLDHACVLQAGAVRCWGENDSGQLGGGVLPRGRAGASPVAAWDRGQLRDVDRDGRITVVCLGDSNTQAMAGASPPWCDRLAPLLPAGFRVVNRGLGGATATTAASLLDASAPLAHALENDAPDVALLAYGTNDVLAKVASREIVAAIARHARRLQAEGVAPFIALVPPLRSDDVASNRAVQELNAGLRQAFPAERILDFFSGFGDEALVDRVHQGAAGQARRARIAADLLSGFPAESGP